MKEGLPGAKALPKAIGRKCDSTLCNQQDQMLFLSAVLGSKPGMTKKTIIL